MADRIDPPGKRDIAPVTHIVRSAEPALPTIRFVPANELLAQPSPVNWLVRLILPCGSMATLIGASGTFKSNIALDLAASIATGIDWHGHPTRQGAVFFLAGEGNHGIARRLKAWTTVRGDSLTNAPLFVSTSAIALIEPLNAAAVAAEVHRLTNATGHRPELVVVDTLARNFGAGDENSTADMGMFIASIDLHIRKLFDCAVLIVHHTGWNDAGRGRGSSALRAAVDVEIVCERTDRVVTVKCSKAKDSAEFEPLAFEACVTELPWVGEDGLPETSFVMNAIEVEPAAEKSIGLGVNQQRALETLRTMYEEYRKRLADAGHDPKGALVTVSDWRDRCGLDRWRIREVSAALERRHLIKVEKLNVVLL